MRAISRLLIVSVGAAGYGTIASASTGNGGISHDLVAACFDTGQVRAILAGTDVMGPPTAIGVSPQALVTAAQLSP